MQSIENLLLFCTGEVEEEEEEDADSSDDENEEDISMAEEPGLDSGCTAVVALLRGNKHYMIVFCHSLYIDLNVSTEMRHYILFFLVPSFHHLQRTRALLRNVHLLCVPSRQLLRLIFSWHNLS